MVAVARERLPGADIRTTDAYALPFPDHSLHGYRADKVLHALADPAAALREARRVLIAGGRAVLIGQDWDTFVIDSDDPALTRTVVHAKADTVPSPRAARRHRNLLLDAGFEDVGAQVRTAVLTDAAALPVITGLAEAARDTGALTAAEASAWTADQRARARTGRLFLALPSSSPRPPLPEVPAGARRKLWPLRGDRDAHRLLAHLVVDRGGRARVVRIEVEDLLAGPDDHGTSA